ncbi:hypothetical protein M5K25_024349 [Dendrobium thyrsiflorum]|uniref:CCHC-type domain-containing protein n=1 Tax=Dendrobium thyrsiflorum TaxID=117978 RepID=A0ABD0U1N3_DENTH
MGGPWIIASNIIGMDRWTPNSSPNSLQGLHSPIWIHLPQLPLMYWYKTNITWLANMLGEPLWMDSHTSTWGRSSYARIYVRIDLSQQLQPGVWINGLHGHFFQKVEYEGFSSFCFACGFIGHENDKCSYKAATQNPPSSPSQQQATSRPAILSQAVIYTPRPPQPKAPSQPSNMPNRKLLLSPDQDETSLSNWNLVTRRCRGKPKAPKEQGTRPQAEPPIQFSAEKLQQMEETSNRIVNFCRQQPRASKSRLDREILRLGPLSALATSLRKRKKTSTDFIGGDLVPSSA